MIVIKSAGARAFLRAVIPFVIIPMLVIFGAVVFDESRYLFISMGVAIAALMLFLTGFEKKQTGSRRMVIASVMTALSVAGRFIPIFKPVTAITVISGVYLGGEAGFLVGAMSALLSNFYFGQGPWTPFQMLAWGMIGLVSGFFSDSMKKRREILLTYGFLAGVIYSMLMDVWTVLWYDSGFNLKLYSAAIITALPHTLLYSVSNVLFLWLIGRPFGEKLERIKLKYGI